MFRKLLAVIAIWFFLFCFAVQAEGSGAASQELRPLAYAQRPGNDTTGEKDEQKEREIREFSEIRLAELRMRYGCLSQETNLYRSIRRIYDRLLVEAGLNPSTYHLDIILDKEPNGMIFRSLNTVALTWGMLGLLGENGAVSDETIAGILAHEISHAFLGEYRDRLERDEEGELRVDERWEYVIRDHIHHYDQEARADKEAVRLMNKAGLNPNGAAKAMRRLYDATKKFSLDTQIPPYSILGSHPPTLLRCQAVEKYTAMMFFRNEGKPAVKIPMEDFTPDDMSKKINSLKEWRPSKTAGIEELWEIRFIIFNMDGLRELTDYERRSLARRAKEILIERHGVAPESAELDFACSLATGDYSPPIKKTKASIRKIAKGINSLPELKGMVAKYARLVSMDTPYGKLIDIKAQAEAWLGGFIYNIAFEIAKRAGLDKNTLLMEIAGISDVLKDSVFLFDRGDFLSGIAREYCRGLKKPASFTGLEAQFLPLYEHLIAVGAELTPVSEYLNGLGQFAGPVEAGAGLWQLFDKIAGKDALFCAAAVKFILRQDFTPAQKMEFLKRYPTIWLNGDDERDKAIFKSPHYESSEGIMSSAKRTVKDTAKGQMPFSWWIEMLGMRGSCEKVSRLPPSKVVLPWEEEEIRLTYTDGVDWVEIHGFLEAAGLSRRGFAERFAAVCVMPWGHEALLAYISREDPPEEELEKALSIWQGVEKTRPRIFVSALINKGVLSTYMEFKLAQKRLVKLKDASLTERIKLIIDTVKAKEVKNYLLYRVISAEKAMAAREALEALGLLKGNIAYESLKAQVELMIDSYGADITDILPMILKSGYSYIKPKDARRLEGDINYWGHKAGNILWAKIRETDDFKQADFRQRLEMASAVYPVANSDRDKAILADIKPSGLDELEKAIPLLFSPEERINSGHRAFSLYRELNKEASASQLVEAVCRYFPDATPYRDEILGDILLSCKVRPSYLKEIRRLLYSENPWDTGDPKAPYYLAVKASIMDHLLGLSVPEKSKALFELVSKDVDITRAALAARGDRTDLFKALLTCKEPDSMTDPGFKEGKEFLRSLEAFFIARLYDAEGIEKLASYTASEEFVSNMIHVPEKEIKRLKQETKRSAGKDAAQIIDNLEVLRQAFKFLSVVLRHYDEEERVDLISRFMARVVELEEFDIGTVFAVLLEEMGTVHIKAGQYLADMEFLPKEVRAGLNRLKSEVVPLNPFDAMEILEEKLPPEVVAERMASFGPMRGSGSVRQTHDISGTKGDEELKIKRPEQIHKLEKELARLRDIIGDLNNRPELMKGAVIPGALVDEVGELVREEALCANEIENQRHIRGLLSGRRVNGRWEIAVPVIDEGVSDDIIVIEERMPGVELRKALPGMDTEASRELRGGLLEVMFDMIFEHGVYHADPHDSNFLVTLGERGQLSIIDFGMVGRLSDENKARFCQILTTWASDSPLELTELLFEMYLAEGRHGSLSELGRIDYVKQVIAAFFNDIKVSDEPFAAKVLAFLNLVDELNLHLPMQIRHLAKVVGQIGFLIDGNEDIAMERLGKEIAKEAFKGIVSPQKPDARIVAEIERALGGTQAAGTAGEIIIPRGTLISGPDPRIYGGLIQLSRTVKIPAVAGAKVTIEIEYQDRGQTCRSKFTLNAVDDRIKFRIPGLKTNWQTLWQLTQGRRSAGPAGIEAYRETATQLEQSILRPLAAGEKNSKENSRNILEEGISLSLSPIVRAELDELGRPNNMTHRDFVRELSRRDFTYGAIHGFSDSHTDWQLREIEKDLADIIREKIMKKDTTFVIYDVGLGYIPAELSQFLTAFYNVLIKVCRDTGTDYTKWTVEVCCVDSTRKHFQEVPDFLNAYKVDVNNNGGKYISELGPKLHYVECNILNRGELMRKIAQENIGPADYILYRHVLYLTAAIDPYEGTREPQEGRKETLLWSGDMNNSGITTGMLEIYLAIQGLYSLAKQNGTTRLVIEPSSFINSKHIPIFIPPGCSQIKSPRGIGILAINEPSAMPDGIIQFVQDIRRNAVAGSHVNGFVSPAVTAMLEAIKNAAYEKMLSGSI